MEISSDFDIRVSDLFHFSANARGVNLGKQIGGAVDLNRNVDYWHARIRFPVEWSNGECRIPR